MSHRNAKPARGQDLTGGGGGTVINNSDAMQMDIITEIPPLSSDSLFKISCLVSDLTDFYLALCWEMIDSGSFGFNRIFSQLIACCEAQDHLLNMLKGAADV